MERGARNLGIETAAAQQGHYHVTPQAALLKLSSRHPGLTRLQYWIAENDVAARRISLEEAARIACLEPCHLSRTFRRLVGMSFKQWRSSYRIAWAVVAVRGGGRTLSQIIQESGYQDRRAFERAFKRIIGKTPGELNREVAGWGLRSETRSEAFWQRQSPGRQ